MGLRKFNPRDAEGRFKKLPNRPRKQELEELYWEKKINTPEIGEILGVSKASVRNWMKEYNIPQRSQGQSLKITHKHRFWRNPEYRKKTTEAIQKKHRSREMRDKKSKVGKRLWKNPKFKAKMSRIQKELWKKPEHRTKISNGRRRMWQNPEYRSKMTEERKRRWRDPEYKQRVIRASRKSLVKKPTEPEQIVIELIERYDLPFQYTGDGEVIIDGLNPDFIHNNGERKAIEVFGRVFHNPEESFFDVPWKQQYWGKILEYKKRGYNCLILWEDETKEDMLEKIREFA